MLIVFPLTTDIKDGKLFVADVEGFYRSTYV